MGIKKKKYGIVSSDGVEECVDKEDAIRQATNMADDINEEVFVVQIIGVAKTHGKAYYEDLS